MCLEVWFRSFGALGLFLHGVTINILLLRSLSRWLAARAALCLSGQAVPTEAQRIHRGTEKSYRNLN